MGCYEFSVEMDQRDSSRMGSKREATLAVEYHQKNINTSSGFYPQSLEDRREVFKEGCPWRKFSMISPSLFQTEYCMDVTYCESGMEINLAVNRTLTKIRSARYTTSSMQK